MPQVASGVFNAPSLAELRAVLSGWSGSRRPAPSFNLTYSEAFNLHAHLVRFGDGADVRRREHIVDDFYIEPVGSTLGLDIIAIDDLDPTEVEVIARVGAPR